METIKVNMTPCEDVKTIHASQNDNEAREWGFELHNNGEKIDSSSISDQLVFKAYEGGTEQILPENGSTPTTSPFKGDIKYPQGLLTDQEFLYRESPTEEDGLAKITDIKGNTLVWNQVAPSMSSSVWVANRCTKTVSGNTFSLVGTTSTSSSFGVYIALANLKLIVNHDYLFMCIVNTNRGNRIRFTFDADIRYTTITPNQDNVFSRVVSTATENPVVCYVDHPSSVTTSDTVTIKNLMIVDLTMLNDSRITDLDSFRTYYPLDYYSYNQGTLLSFNGNGIKTANTDETEESTLSLPISTYFPTGMKSAGSVYDELAETKAINRLIKTVVDGTSKTANYYGTFQGHQLFYIDLFATTYVNVSNMTNLKSNHYLTAGSATMDDRYIRYQTVAYHNINIGRIYWNDDRYTSANEMNTALQSSPLEIVSLAQSETVETFSVASLVTENAEIPLSNEDGVLIGKCTEQLSSESGFFDAKIKLADEDGECYSNKIQLHIERKPS